MILDITDPRCDVKECFQKFINHFWDKHGGPGAVGGDFKQIDVWLWVLTHRKSNETDTTRCKVWLDQSDKFVLDIIATWKKVGFIKNRSVVSLGPDNKEFEIVNLDDWYVE
jgi:hypothetical protein